MRLSELVRGLAISGDPRADPEIMGVTHDSRTVAPGDLFVAFAGQRFDGRAFAEAAVAKGAVAVIGPDSGEIEGLSVPWLTTADPRAVLGPLAARAYGHPERELILAGVTGTNGKSTVATLLTAILDAAGHAAGFLGTLGYRYHEHEYAGGHTTPEASDLFRILRWMRSDGAAAVAMEVSSHALTMGRVAGAEFDTAVFTNLTRDHLDYHKDFDDYFAAKRKLFDLLKPGARPAVNVDDHYGRQLAAEMPDALTFGERGEVSARDVAVTATGTRGILLTPRGEVPFVSPLLGRYNVSNLLAAAAGAETLGLPHDAVVAAFAGQQPVPGRMEPVVRGQPFPVFVDYAHTDAALDAALRSAREIAAGGKVAVVFGCGGDRDQGKRPLMGKVAGELADLVIATSDNPRSEDPLAILAAVEEGLRQSGNTGYRLVPDRREAIREALAAAEAGWVVLVAGKGHEREQIVGTERLPFSDLEEIGKALEERAMARLTVAEAAEAVGGRLMAGDPQAVIDGAAIDSRAVRGGEVFFAFPGAQVDGHRFVADALARGAAAAVVNRGRSDGSVRSIQSVGSTATGAVIEVEDTFRALHDLARRVRTRVPEKLVGITGSAGKTTTKELLGAILASRFKVSWTPGNLNNLYGFPLSLLNVPDGTEWMVAEMGMSTPGELRQLSLLGRPDAAVFTVVRPVHLEFFGTVQAIAEAKSEILAGLSPGGFVVANADDPEVTRIAKRHGARIVWYGIHSERADVRALNLKQEIGAIGSRFTLEAGGQSQEVRLPLHGLYNVENCVAAAACAWALGLSLEEIAAAVATVKPASMRGIVHQAAGGYTLVDDSYNSNPDAVGKALESAGALAGRRRVAVLGDMRELGPEAPRFHREAGEHAARLGFSPVVAVGELSRELAAGARAGGAESVWLPDAAAAADWAAGELRQGDVVLVKASRGVGLDRVVKRLLGNAGDEAGAH